MNLVAPLACGIAGAAGGSATLRRRGTSTPATYYTAFEGGTQYTSALSLDQNGGATVYVNEPVDITVRDVNGATVRTFTVGESAPAVEVISRGFTGADYRTGAVGRSKPVPLSTVLDRWYDSAGAPDFKVRVNGVDRAINFALGEVAGVFTNVKSPEFGAVGDGVTNDSAAINAAAAAAGAGGTVRFPAGTYRTTIALEAVGGQTWELAPGAAIHVETGGFNAVRVTGGSAERAFVMRGGDLLATAPHSGAAIYTEGPVTLESVRIGGSGGGSFTGHGISCDDGYAVSLSGVTMELAGTASMWARSATTSKPLLLIEDCDLSMTNAGRSGVCMEGRGGRIVGTSMEDVATSGTITLVQWKELNGTGIEISGCTFTANAGSTSRAIDTLDLDSVTYQVILAGNTYVNIDTRVYSTVHTPIRDLDQRFLYVETSDVSISVDPSLYDSVYIVREGATGNLDVIIENTAPAGNAIDVFVLNSVAAGISVGFNAIPGTIRTTAPVTARVALANLEFISARFKTFDVSGSRGIAQVGDHAKG